MGGCLEIEVCLRKGNLGSELLDRRLLFLGKDGWEESVGTLE